MSSGMSKLAYTSCTSSLSSRASTILMVLRASFSSSLTVFLGTIVSSAWSNSAGCVRSWNCSPAVTTSAAPASMAAAIDAGADDVVQDGEQFQVLTQPADFAAVRDALAAAGIEFDQAELTMVPKNTVKLEENDARKTMRIVDALEDSDDVQEVYANFDIPEDILERLAG